MALIFTKLTLLLLSAYGWYALFGFGYKNGSLSMVSKQRLTGHLGDTRETYDESFTGIPRVDQHLSALLTFFWPLVDGSRPDASLHSFYFAGQGIAIWMATLIEGLRAGNKWLVISFTTTFGLFFQAIGMAIVGPIFLFINLMTSPTVATPSASNLKIDPSELQALPFSTITGFIIPTILMSLHAPTYITYEQKAFFVRLWQIFPILCYLSQHIWKRILPLSSRSRSVNIETQIRMLGKVYFFGTICASVAHTATWAISLTAYLFPALFAPQYVGYLLPARVFLPPMPWWDIEADSIGTGAHWFLQWDEVLTSTMYLLWACSLTIKARQKVGKTSGVIVDVLGLLSSALLVGPAGAALCALWERDEIVLSTELKRSAKSSDTDKAYKRTQRSIERHFASQTHDVDGVRNVLE